MQIVVDGLFKDSDEPAVPASSRGLMYGEGCFETFRTYRGQTFYLDDHIKRLQDGLTFLGLFQPDELEGKPLKRLLYRLLDKNNLLHRDAIVRLQVWGEGGRGYGRNNSGETHFSLLASECPDKFDPPKLVTVDTRRIPSESLSSDFKFTNGINYIVAAREAEQEGGDDALMQTIDGWVSETTIANIFWLKEGTVFTPSRSCDILPGITRKIVIYLSERMGMTVEEGLYPLEEIKDAEAVWVCNSVREVLSVKAINRKTYSRDHSFLKELETAYREYRNKHLESLDI